MLRAFGHLVATCWVLLAQIWPVSNLSQKRPTCCNTSQHGGQTRPTMLRYVAICWVDMLLSLGRGFKTTQHTINCHHKNKNVITITTTIMAMIIILILSHHHHHHHRRRHQGLREIVTAVQVLKGLFFTVNLCFIIQIRGEWWMDPAWR